MKSSTVALTFSLLATSAFALPYTKPLVTRSAITDCGTNQACVTVATAINGWIGSVDTVNQFLNTPTLDPKVALAAAQLEPGFLSTLGGTTGLSATGTAAVSTLMTLFPGIPSLLSLIVEGAEGTQSGSAVNGINDLRCNKVLPAIGDLWIAAAAAVGADVPPRPMGPNFCPLS